MMLLLNVVRNEKGASVLGVVITLIVIGILIMITIPKFLGDAPDERAKNVIETHEDAIKIKDIHNDRIKDLESINE